MKTTIFTKTIAALLIVFAFGQAAYTQEQTYKVGDTVEARSAFGEWEQGTVIGIEDAHNYRVHLDRYKTADDFGYFNSGQLKLIKGNPAPSATKNNSARTSQSTNSESAASTDCKGNDWSAWGVYKEMEFMNSARDKYSTGFSISTSDLICMVKTRKVAFRLTSAEENELNDLRNSPQLIAAIRASFIGGAEKSKPKGGTASVVSGRYACGKMAGIAGSLHFEARPDIFITGGTSYKNLSSAGAFSYDATTRKIVWKTGALAGKGISGEYEPDVITLRNTKNEILYSCNRANN